MIGERLHEPAIVVFDCVASRFDRSYETCCIVSDIP
jgi:hypothetical protein